MMAATMKRLGFGWTLWPASLMFKPRLSTSSSTVARISFEMTILFFLSPPPPSSHCPPPLPPPCPPPCPPNLPSLCPPTPLPPTCSPPSCPPLPHPPPPLTLDPLLLWLSISSKFSIVHQTKQRLKALLCCSSPVCKLLNRPECLEI